MVIVFGCCGEVDVVGASQLEREQRASCRYQGTTEYRDGTQGELIALNATGTYLPG